MKIAERDGEVLVAIKDAAVHCNGQTFELRAGQAVPAEIVEVAERSGTRLPITTATKARSTSCCPACGQLVPVARHTPVVDDRVFRVAVDGKFFKDGSLYRVCQGQLVWGTFATVLRENHISLDRHIDHARFRFACQGCGHDWHDVRFDPLAAERRGLKRLEATLATADAAGISVVDALKAKKKQIALERLTQARETLARKRAQQREGR